jgi:hypothetical protein
MYNQFLASLGKDIDLATHRGFNGRCVKKYYHHGAIIATISNGIGIWCRLDAVRFSNGRYFPYFADDHVEVK